MPSLNTSLLENVPIVLPPIKQQEYIGRVARSIDDKIELNQRMNATLEATAQALFKSWFVDFDPVKAKAEGRQPEGMDPVIAALFSDGFTESLVGPIPKGWLVSEIGKEVDVLGGSTPNTKEPTFWDDGKYFWVTPKDLSKMETPILIDTERKITEIGIGEISSGQLPVDTVLLSSRAPVGYLALAKIPVSINQGFIAMVCKKALSPLYIINWTHFALDEIKARAGGTTFAEISKSGFRPINVIVPPKQVIASFDCLAKPLYDRMTSSVIQSKILEDLRDLLLPQLISGKLRVRDAEHEIKKVV
jgi:type I restriction enzyme S subunit